MALSRSSSQPALSFSRRRGSLDSAGIATFPSPHLDLPVRRSSVSDLRKTPNWGSPQTSTYPSRTQTPVSARRNDHSSTGPPSRRASISQRQPTLTQHQRSTSLTGPITASGSPGTAPPGSNYPDFAVALVLSVLFDGAKQLTIRHFSSQSVFAKPRRCTATVNTDLQAIAARMPDTHTAVIRASRELTRETLFRRLESGQWATNKSKQVCWFDSTPSGPALSSRPQYTLQQSKSSLQSLSSGPQNYAPQPLSKPYLPSAGFPRQSVIPAQSSQTDPLAPRPVNIFGPFPANVSSTPAPSASTRDNFPIRLVLERFGNEEKFTLRYISPPTGQRERSPLACTSKISAELALLAESLDPSDLTVSGLRNSPGGRGLRTYRYLQPGQWKTDKHARVCWISSDAIW